MDEKLKELFKKFYEANHEALFKEPFFAENMRLTFYAGFYAGCAAQSVADRVAVDELLIISDADGDMVDHNMAINEALRALTAAAIVGGK